MKRSNNIKVVEKDNLPEENEYVLIYVRNSTWLDDSDIDNKRFWKVARFICGISQEERKILALSGNPEDELRSRTYKTQDEHGNNLVPYYWKEFGIGGYFGQEAKYWVPLLREKDINV
jgi:hypothetical protein